MKSPFPMYDEMARSIKEAEKHKMRLEKYLATRYKSGFLTPEDAERELQITTRERVFLLGRAKRYRKSVDGVPYITIERAVEWLCTHP